MTATHKKLKAAVEAFFTDLRRIRQSGAATDERSTYFPLATLLSAVGATLKPKVLCIVEPTDQGAGHPDLYLYVEKQLQQGRPRKGQAQTPERGVVEVKAPDKDTQQKTVRDQVSRYWKRYSLVLVTNLREFELVGQNAVGDEVTLETFRLADSEDSLDQALDKPRAFADRVGGRLSEYLCRALAHKAALTEPNDLAWLLASYARDGLTRVEQAGEAPSLQDVRSALEEALGVRFEGDQGAHFFHSTLVQTLFYGVFSAWVLWTRSKPPPSEQFRWRDAVWHLRAPVLKALFHQISNPMRLEPLGLVEVLDWTGAALNRVDQQAFFTRFNEGEAVPYFYEPFLQAFDPQLRKQLGVWYTPSEVVRYMVARVDKALKEDLGITDGLAAENVYALDPCCGTGAYLAEVLRRIAANLEGRGLGALAGSMVKKAALKRVFGFEIMPAPFVVAHLQVGLTLQDLDASLAEGGTDRVGVYLTNALTGWEPTDEEKQVLAFPELEEERDRANEVKRDRPILVILGNPPYNGFAGMAVDEERELSESYRSTNRVRRPEGQGLNDLYVRFFRMAERRIAEKTGQGVVCFISNYSWLDGLSFTGMRERYLDAFDTVRIDCLNGDKYKTGKVAPDGSPDPSIFSTESDPVGIQVGTAIATLVRNAEQAPTETIEFRHLWGQKKREELIATAEATPDSLYEHTSPILPLGLPFLPAVVSEGWFDWPSLPELFPVSFPGVQTKRDAFLIDVDLERLKNRIADYFDCHISHDELARRYPVAMKSSSGFAERNARKVRDDLLKRGGPRKDGFICFVYRPFDVRWLYWDDGRGLLGRPSGGFRRHAQENNLFIEAREREAKDEYSRGTIVRSLSDNFGNGFSNFFPALVIDDGLVGEAEGSRRHNLSAPAKRYLQRLGTDASDLFYHFLATVHDPTYRKANAGALRMEWPRIPLPGWPNGDRGGAVEALAESARRGRQLAQLLDSDTLVSGVTQGTLRPEIGAIAVPATIGGRNMTSNDYSVTAGWGRFGAARAVMPGKGRVEEREYTTAERAAVGSSLSTLGETTVDIYLNDRAFWRNVPTAAWNYKLGGYRVLKKWLSYREKAILDRPLTPEEVEHFTHTARRIAAILITTSQEKPT